MEFDDAAGLRNDELDVMASDRSEIPGFGVEWNAGCRIPGALSIRQKRLADVFEPDLFSVLEVVDGGVVAAAAADPVAEEKGEVNDVGMKRRSAGR